MKKTILFFLLLAGTGDVLHAQSIDLPNQTESLFDNPPPGKSNAQFTFYLSNRKRVMLEFGYISQTERFPDLDSLVRIASRMLLPLKDSLKADGMVRRVDVVLTNAVPKIRIISHPEFSNTYTVKDNELMQLKVNQDTVRIIGISNSRVMWTVIDVNGKKSLKEMSSSFAITLILNNVEDMGTLEPDALAKCLATLNPKIERFYKRDGPNSPPYSYRAGFNMASGKMFSPFNVSYIPSSPTGQEPFSGVVGFSMVAVRGSIVPSMQAGVSFNRHNNYFTNSFRFYLEGQYFFSRDAANKLITDPNTFAVFQFMQSSKRNTNNNALTFEGNITLGYLIRRTGEWYEPNTFKLGLPLLKNRHLSIEPQLVFSGFFKHVTPSIKVTFNF
ncbi:MAG: hypothetical protein JWQ30_2423 [Sediminibacterium sp.]|nr:hypothetical protein [Sediminibacterium sp.]